MLHQSPVPAHVAVDLPAHLLTQGFQFFLSDNVQINTNWSQIRTKEVRCEVHNIYFFVKQNIGYVGPHLAVRSPEQFVGTIILSHTKTWVINLYECIFVLKNGSKYSMRLTAVWQDELIRYLNNADPTIATTAPRWCVKEAELWCEWVFVWRIDSNHKIYHSGKV